MQLPPKIGRGFRRPASHLFPQISSTFYVFDITFVAPELQPLSSRSERSHWISEEFSTTVICSTADVCTLNNFSTCQFFPQLIYESTRLGLDRFWMNLTPHIKGTETFRGLLYPCLCYWYYCTAKKNLTILYFWMGKLPQLVLGEPRPLNLSHLYLLKECSIRDKEMRLGFTGKWIHATTWNK